MPFPSLSTLLVETKKRIGSPGLIEVLAQTATGPTPPDGRDQTLRLLSDTGFRPVVKMNPELPGIPTSGC